MAKSKTAAAPLHPYYPLEAEVIGYIANDLSVAQLLMLFGAGVAVISAISLTVVWMVKPKLGAGETMTVLWFVSCEFSLGGGGDWAGGRGLIEMCGRLGGFIHFFFEGTCGGCPLRLWVFLRE
jgi:hypothetical protein